MHLRRPELVIALLLAGVAVAPLHAAPPVPLPGPRLTGGVTSFASDPSGTRFLATGGGGELALWRRDATGAKPLATIPEGVHRAGFGPRGEGLATLGLDGTLATYRVGPRKLEPRGRAWLRIDGRAAEQVLPLGRGGSLPGSARVWIAGGRRLLQVDVPEAVGAAPRHAPPAPRWVLETARSGYEAISRVLLARDPTEGTPRILASGENCGLIGSGAAAGICSYWEGALLFLREGRGLAPLHTAMRARGEVVAEAFSPGGTAAVFRIGRARFLQVVDPRATGVLAATGTHGPVAVSDAAEVAWATPEGEVLLVRRGEYGPSPPARIHQVSASAGTYGSGWLSIRPRTSPVTALRFLPGDDGALLVGTATGEVHLVSILAPS